MRKLVTLRQSNRQDLQKSYYNIVDAFAVKYRFDIQTYIMYSIHKIRKTESIVRPTLGSNGYWYYNFCISKDDYIDRCPIVLHKIIAYFKFGIEAFKIGIEVRHLNGDKLDNSWENISIGTSQDNKLDVPNHKRLGRNARKLTKDQVKEIRDRYKKFGYKRDGFHKQLSKEFNISPRTLYDIIRGRIWTNI